MQTSPSVTAAFPHGPTKAVRLARRGLTGSLAALTLAACSGPPPAPPAPVLDAEQVASRARTATRLDEPARIVFEWSLTEQGARFRGRGVARVEAPYRARLDLFLPGGETIARAALVDTDLRIPPGVPEGIIPPPHLLWGALGVFHPGSGAALLGGEQLADGDVRLRYAIPGGQQVHYTLRAQSVVQVELLERGDVVQRVVVESDGEARYPRQATYRDLAAVRELNLIRESVEHVEPYPPDIWDPIR